MKGSRFNAAVLVFFLVVLAMAANYRRIRERVTPFGKLTAQEVLAQSEPLCRLLASPSASLQLTAARHANSRRPFWSVTCEDQNLRYVAEVNWDADSGDLIQVSCNASSNRNGISLDEQSTVRIAEKWLRDLGIASGGSVWQQSGKPQQVPSLCIVRFNSGTKRALLKLDRSSGNLVTAEQWSQQSSSLESL